MAQRLSDEGKRIQLLVMVDAYPHPRQMSRSQRLLLGLQRTKRRISQMSQRSFPDPFPTLSAALRSVRYRGRGMIPTLILLKLRAYCLRHHVASQTKSVVALAQVSTAPLRRKDKIPEERER